MPQSNPFQNYSKEHLMAMAQSDAGKKLLALLQQNNSAQLQEAMNQAAAGNYDQVKDTLSSVLHNEQAQKLLKEMRD